MTERNERFDEMLDDSYEPYRIGELTFYPSDILYNCDPIAYRIAVSEHEDWEAEEDAQED